MGWTVLRFWYHDVTKNPDYVIQTILYYVRCMKEILKAQGAVSLDQEEIV